MLCRNLAAAFNGAVSKLRLIPYKKLRSVVIAIAIIIGANWSGWKEFVQDVYSVLSRFWPADKPNVDAKPQVNGNTLVDSTTSGEANPKSSEVCALVHQAVAKYRSSDHHQAEQALVKLKEALSLARSRGVPSVNNNAVASALQIWKTGDWPGAISEFVSAFPCEENYTFR